MYHVFTCRYLLFDAFSQSVRALAPRSQLSDDEQVNFSNYLKRLYTLYEDRNGVVDANQLLCGVRGLKAINWYFG